jgi:hypothetical protein
MGSDAYIAKYLVKTERDLAQSSSLLLDAIRVSQERPSVAPDALTNEARPALRVLQRLINNHTRSVEIPITLCLSSLLGMQQFSSSHSCKSVWLASAVGHVERQLRSLPAAMTARRDRSPRSVATRTVRSVGGRRWTRTSPATWRETRREIRSSSRRPSTTRTATND